MEFFETYLKEIVMLIVTGVFAWLGKEAKKLYEKHVNTQIKKDVVNTVVEAVEQIYKDLHGEDKLNKALEAASEMLKAQGVPVTDLELRTLIEAAVGSFNGVFYPNLEPVVVTGVTAE